MSDILVVGSANVDLVMATERLPIPGETRFGQFSRSLGGKGANQAVAAARAGGSVTMACCLGRDEFGTLLRAGLAAENICMDGVVDVDGPSGVAVIVTALSGNNVIVIAGGANAQLLPARLTPALFHKPRFLMLQLEIPLETSSEAIALGRAAGATIVLDPAPAMPLSSALLEQVDWLTPNETEARILLGIADEKINGVEAALALRDRGARNVIVKLGERGVVLLQAGDDPVSVPARTVEAIDTTAAGDAFNGAFVAGLSSDMSPVNAARFAVAAAGIAVTRCGAQSAMPTRDEINALIHADKVRSYQT